MYANELLREWGHRARAAQVGHYKTAVKLENRHRRLGIFVVSLNAAVGTAVFASLSDNLDSVLGRLVVGFFSILTAVLAGIQTFDRAGERAETHRMAATQFSGLQREVEMYLATGDIEEGSIKRFVAEFNSRYVQLVNESPTVDEKIHIQVKDSLAEKHHPLLGAPGNPGLKQT